MCFRIAIRPFHSDFLTLFGWFSPRPNLLTAIGVGSPSYLPGSQFRKTAMTFATALRGMALYTSLFALAGQYLLYKYRIRFVYDYAIINGYLSER